MEGLPAAPSTGSGSDGAGGAFTELGKDSNDLTAKWVVKSGINLIGRFTTGPDLQGGLIQPGGNSSRSNGMNQSDPAALSNGLAASKVKVWPNPAHDHITISLFSQEAKEILFSLYDPSGHLLQQRLFYCAAGANNLSWDLTNYPAGVYYLSYGSQGGKNIKIVKE